MATPGATMALEPAGAIAKKRRYTIYPSSMRRAFYPDYLRSFRLEFDAAGNKLVFSPAHVVGQTNTMVDLRPWTGCSSILDEFQRSDLPMETLVLSAHPECNDELLTQLLGFPSLRDLSLSNCPSITLRGVDTLCSLTNLTSLDLSNNNAIVTDPVVGDICRCLTALTSLDISQCGAVSDLGIVVVANTLGPQLVRFACSKNTRVTFRSINELLMRSEKLIDLDVSRCSSLHFLGIVVETHNKIQQYVARRLRSLNINYCRQMDRVALQYITTALPELQSFYACFVHNIKDDVLYALLEGCKQLRELHVNGCQQLTPKCLEIVHKHLPRLHRLSLGHLTPVDPSNPFPPSAPAKTMPNPTIRDLLSCASHLRALDLCNFVSLTDGHFPPASQPVSSTLTSANLARCPQLTSLSVVFFAQYCPHLEELDISGNAHMTDTAMASIALACVHIRRVVLNHCHGLTDQAVVTLVEHAPSLQELHLSFGDVVYPLDVTREGRQGRLSLSPPWVHEESPLFSPRGGHQYTDGIWPAIFRHARALHTLVVSHQWGITLAGVDRVDGVLSHGRPCRRTMSVGPRGGSGEGRRGLSVAYLDLRGCVHVHEAQVSAFLPLFPRLVHVCLPHHVGQNKAVLSHKYYTRHLAGLAYIQDYDRAFLDDQVAHIQHTAEADVPPTKTSLSQPSSSSTLYPAWKSLPLVLLRPHPQAAAWYYRDCFVRRRLLENRAVRILYNAFLSYKIWKKVKHLLMGRRILQVYRNYKKESRRQRAIEHFIHKRNVRIISRYYIHYRLHTRRAALKIQRKFRTYRSVLLQRRRTLQHRMATLIQKRARGMIVRTSEQYVIAQIFMKLPPFWKKIGNLLAPTHAASRVRERLKPHWQHKTEGYEVRELRTQTSDILYHITHKPVRGTDGRPAPSSSSSSSSSLASSISLSGAGTRREEGAVRKLAPKLQQVIPQTFDLSPYVSLADGRKLCFHSSPVSLFHATFLDRTRNTVHDTLTDQQRHYLSGNFSNRVDHVRDKHITTAAELDVHLPVHVYNFRYWPITQRHVGPRRAGGGGGGRGSAPTASPSSSSFSADATLFNPLVNNFEVVLNKKFVLYCDKCALRLRLIHCRVCNKGYCFHCAYYEHSSLLTKSHTMDYIEPRVFHLHSVSPSLVYYINNAQFVLYSLAYITKYLSSQAEVQRLQREKALILSYEREQDRLRAVYLQAQETYKLQYQHANRIILFYKAVVAKRIVAQKRRQRELETWHTRVQRCLHGVVRFQILVRRYLTRMWLSRLGYVFNSVCKYYFTVRTAPAGMGGYGGGGGGGRGGASKAKRRPSLAARGIEAGRNESEEKTEKKVFHKPKKRVPRQKTVSREEIQARCELEQRRRAFYARTLALATMEANYATAFQLLETSIAHWRNKYAELSVPVSHFIAKRDESLSSFKQMQLTSHMENLTASETAIAANKKEVKVAQLKAENMASRLEVLQNIQWWIQQILRVLYRKLKILTVSLQDILQRLHFVAVEYFSVDRIYQYILQRQKSPRQSIEGLSPDSIDNEDDWLALFGHYTLQQLIRLDTQQESLVKEETLRLEKEIQEMRVLHSLLSELLHSLQVNNQLLAERVHLEKQLILLPYGSEAAIQCNEQLLLLKNKQKILTSQSLDSLKLTLQEMLDSFDKKNLNSFAFPNDRPDLPVEEMPSMEIVMLEPYTGGGKHICVEQLGMVHLLQPWLVTQCIEDIRYEERINAKLLRYRRYQEEYQVQQAQVEEYNKTITRLLEESRELEVQVLAHADPPPEESLEESLQRGAKLAGFRTELQARTVEVELARKAVADAQLRLLPVTHNMSEVLRDVHAIKKQLQERLSSRDAAITHFFETESERVSRVVPLVSSLQQQLEDYHAATVLRLDSLSHSREALQRLSEASSCPPPPPASLYHYLPPHVRLCPGSLELQSCHALAQPDVVASVCTALTCQLAVLRQTAESLAQYYLACQSICGEEGVFYQGVAGHGGRYRRLVSVFLSDLQVSRRQRALDMDLHIRQAQLHAFRSSRLQSLQAAKQAQIEKEREEQRLAADKLRNRKSTARKAARGMILAHRQVKRTMHNLVQNDVHEMDREEKKMALNIRTRNKEGLGTRPECVQHVHLTSTPTEYAYFAKQNEHLQQKGLPSYKPMDRSIGNQVYLWTQSTYDDSVFLTDIWLSHRNPAHEHHRVFTGKRAYDEVIEVPGYELDIYLKRDKNKAQGIRGMYLSYTEDDENDFLLKGYARIEPNLEVFGLPNMTLWVQRTPKAKVSTLMNTNALIAEITKVRHLLSEQPDNRNLQSLLHRLNERLSEAHQKEIANQVTDPLTHARELLALDDEDLLHLAKIYASIDTNRLGVITLDQIFKFLGQPLTPLSREVFVSVDALDEKGGVEFGDFLRAIGTYAFFGKEEILRFIYIFADSDRTGSIAAKEFTQLIEVINPIEKVRTRRAMKEMNLTPTHAINFEDFRILNERFPSLFLPAFLLQNAIREKVGGVDWWFQKLSKYKGVRDKMAAEGRYAEEAVARELERFGAEQQRQARIAEREKALEKETNDVKKAWMRAQQFWDEVREDS